MKGVSALSVATSASLQACLRMRLSISKPLDISLPEVSVLYKASGPGPLRRLADKSSVFFSQVWPCGIRYDDSRLHVGYELKTCGE
ncbi:hypothetical protein ElyMa_004868500 [Elysia marginata]|uniref:Secreted protein n=1 Tax=Elysia marginata TaxID=1093978 RepID=A0AAV4ISC3_9GAST|nr:hypothetical protein ElyMa_004868500 [Elysia marginata]